MLGLKYNSLLRSVFVPSRLASTLVVAEHSNTSLNPLTLNTISAAKRIGGDVTCVVAGHKCQSVVDHVSKIEGVKKVLHVESEKFEHFLPEPYSLLLVALQRKFSFSHLLSGSNANGRSVMPRAAALLNCSALTEIIGVQSEDTFTRTIYAGNAIQTVQSLTPVHCITVRGTAFESAEIGTVSTEVESVDAATMLGDSKAVDAVKFIEQSVQKSDRPELASAKVVVSGGRGLKSGENFQLMYDLADKLNAAVGATRAAVDAGYVPNELQVGQTGKIVAPELYFAIGISGAIQHLAGMKDSKIIVAINKDPEAPIFQVADYGLEEDLFKAVPELIKKL